MYRALLNIIFLCSLPLLVFALPEDKDKAMQIIADSTQINYKTGVYIYEGHVKIDQGTTHLTANRLITKNDDRHKIKEAVAYGLNELAEYSTTPKTGDEPMHAKATVIRFYPPKSLVILEGHVIVTQGENSFNGETIIYNMKDQVVTAPATKMGHATIIIEPNKLSS